jgi:hypothetical protein
VNQKQVTISEALAIVMSLFTDHLTMNDEGKRGNIKFKLHDYVPVMIEGKPTWIPTKVRILEKPVGFEDDVKSQDYDQDEIDTCSYDEYYKKALSWSKAKNMLVDHLVELTPQV